MKRILILGGGVGGLSVAQALRFSPVQVTLVDRDDAYLSQSRLYSAAVGSKEPRHLRVRREVLLRGQRNVELILGEAVYLDARQQRLILTDRALPYDVLVVAAGTRSHYERDNWERTAPGLKSAEDATRIREKLRDKDTAVVVVGGGVTGVELAAAAARADRARRVILVEQGTQVLAGFPDPLAASAALRLTQMGVEIRRGAHVTGMDAESVRFSTELGRERIVTRAVLWVGGTTGSSIGTVLNRETGIPLDDAGRVCVTPHLTATAKHPEIFVIGDLARVLHDGLPLPGLATVASQQGRYVGTVIRERLAEYDAAPFEYVDQGRFATLGQGGVGVIGETQLTRTAAWLASKLAQRWSQPGNTLRAYSVACSST